VRVLTPCGALAALLFAAPIAVAQQPAPVATAGPGRIICRTATTCVLGIGDPAQIEYQIDAGALPEADKDRLSKQCVPAGTTPCVVTIEGTEMDDPLKVRAAKITWYN
jgi:hypothetical protein